MLAAGCCCCGLWALRRRVVRRVCRTYVICVSLSASCLPLCLSVCRCWCRWALGRCLWFVVCGACRRVIGGCRSVVRAWRVVKLVHTACAPNASDLIFSQHVLLSTSSTYHSPPQPPAPTTDPPHHPPHRTQHQNKLFFFRAPTARRADAPEWPHPLDRLLPTTQVRPPPRDPTVITEGS